MATTTTFIFAPLTAPTAVNATTASDQYPGDVVTLANGTAVVAYGGQTGLFLRAIGANGAPAGPEVTVVAGANVLDTGPIHVTSLAILNNGSIVVAWADAAATQVVHYRLYDQSLSPLTGVLNGPSHGQSLFEPDVAALSDGGFVLAYTHYFSATDYDIAAQRYSAAGVAVGAEITINGSGATVDKQPSVIGLSEGGFAVVHDRSGSSVWRSVRNADGSQRLADTLFDNLGATNLQPQATRSGTGFAVSYRDSQWSANSDISFARFNAAGVLIAGSPIRASSTSGTDSDVHAAVSGDGYTLIAYNNADNTLGTIVGPDGAAFGLNGALDASAGRQDYASVTWLDRTHVALVEAAYTGAPGADGDPPGVATRIIEVKRAVTGDGAADAIVLISDAFANIVDGGGGDDTIITGEAKDVLHGGAGNDGLYGGAGDDQLFGDDGIDTLYGGDGNDYLEAGPGVSSVLGGEAGNDQIYGGAGADYCIGGDGDDVIVGLGGVDSLYGGAGNDYIVAGDGPGSVVDGGAGANTLWGAGGNDYMVGGEGDDLMVGGANGDYLFGNSGNDTLYGGPGGDYIYSNAGNDFIWTDDVGLAQGPDFIYVGGGTGVDTVADFTPGNSPGHDTIVLSPASGIGNFTQAKAAMVQVGVYTVITMSGGDQLYLYNVQPFQLTADDFLFF